MAVMEITLMVAEGNRAAAAGVYNKYRQPFLDQAPGAKSKQLLVRSEDVQVIHGFATVEDAEAYLSSNLFATDIVGELSSLILNSPEIRIYEEA